MEIYPALLLRWVVQGFMLLGALTFLLQWLLPRWRKFCQHAPFTPQGDSSEGQVNSVDDERKNIMREKLQQCHSEKACSYKERILMPREEAKRKQKEEEFEKFTGPAWKGKGQALGGDVSESTEDITVPTSQQAARRRRIQEPSHSSTNSSKKEEPKPKKVITLPEEPPAGDKNVVTVKLRTPFGKLWQRRFLHTTTVQVLLDYMTTCGFRQTHFTLSTSYPRLNLAEYVNKTLWEMGIQGQVTLNVEDLESE